MHLQVAVLFPAILNIILAIFNIFPYYIGICFPQVFPQLREWCRARKLYLIDCDLRWGVPTDSTTAETIAICLEELDKFMNETNGHPFFLNMLGQK